FRLGICWVKSVILLRIDLLNVAQVFQPHFVVIGPMTRRRVHEASASVVGDVISGEKRHDEVVAMPTKGVRTFGAARIEIAQSPPRRDLRSLLDVISKSICDD